MGIEAVSLVIAAFVNGSVGVAAFIRNYRSRLCVSFAIFSFFLFGHDALSVLEHIESISRYASPRAHNLVTLGLCFSFFWLLRGITPVFKKRIHRVLTAFTPALLLCLLLLFSNWYPILAPWLSWVVHLFLLGPAVLALTCLVQAEKRTVLNRERLRLKYAFWGGFLTLALFVTDALALTGYPFPPLGTLGRTLYLIFIFQTFIQKELMTLEEVVAKIVLFGGIAFILSIIYLLLVSWVGDRPGLFFFNTLIASFVVMVLFDPIRKLTTKITRKLFLPRNALLEEDLDSLSVSLMGVVEPSELARKLSAALQRSFEIKNCQIYLLDRDGLDYWPIDSEGIGAPAEVSASDPLIEYMILRRGRPFISETIENDRDFFHALQARKFCQDCLEGMRRLGADLIIPFLLESKVGGFCTVRTGETTAFSNEQLRLFSPIARQGALVLKNAQTFNVLRDRDKLAAVGEMAAGLAHEIKNPLGAIKGAAELLHERLPATEKESGEFVRIMIQETNRLSKVLSDFLDYAKPRKYDPLSICDPVRVIEHTAALVMHDPRVTFELSIERKGLTVSADPDVLNQVLLNLFLNALQAMDATVENPILKVRIKELRTHRLFPLAESIPFYKMLEGWKVLNVTFPKQFVEIAVIDNGMGISSAELPRIFDPFFTTKPKGTGLGLAISKRLIESMGGSIYVKRNFPRGMIFTLHLPLAREEAEGSPKLREQTV